MSDLVLDAFAGPGGWDQGLRLAGYTGQIVGIEHDRTACLTAMAAGHQRVQADVATFPLGHLAGKVDGLIMSPPCQAWSSAGDQKGKLDQQLVFERIAAFANGREPAKHDWADERSKLTAEPMRWAVALRPRWIALEQVPPVLPLWQYVAEFLRRMGYSVWYGVLGAEEYGVPQTRRRAILTARRDGLLVGPPMQTHQPYRAGREPQTEPDLFGDPLPPPMSMAEALGWGVDGRPAWTVTGGGTESGGGVEVFAYSEARRLIAQARNSGPGAERDPRPLDAPSYTIRAQGSGSHPSGTEWVAERPATTVCGDARLGSPGHRDREGGERQFGEQTVRVTVQEAGILQSFPADYPWQGTKSAQYRQVGDAVPPLLAMHVLRPLLAEAAERAA